MDNLKKPINVLIIISIGALILIIIIETLINDKSPRMSFICDWVVRIILPFVFPLIFGVFSLAYNKDKINPKLWLLIYGCAVFLYIILQANLGFAKATKDLPFAWREEYSIINGTANMIDFDESKLTIEVGDIQFNVPRSTFDTITANGQYAIVYLPNSKYVIDIIDNTGASLTK